MATKEYVIKWFKTAGSMETEIHMVYDIELFKWLDRARNEKLKIVVYEVTDCLLDWS
jgi:hypothetical protein